MTTSSAKLSSRRTARAAKSGFTLVEVMIAAGLSGAILTAVMSSFLMIGRSGAVLYNYIGMEQQARRGLERFGEDTRMASALTWTTSGGSINSVTLTVPHVGSDSFNNQITYSYDSAAGTFSRTEVDTDSSGATTTTTTTVLMRNVSTLAFDHWTAGGATGVQSTSAATTDQLQIHLTLRAQTNQSGTSTTAIAAASNLVVSARYILRNKH